MSAVAAGNPGRGRRRRLSKSSHGTLHELNITPLLDLVMVLLVIFMITTPQLSNDLDMNLPSAQPPKNKPKEKPKFHYVDVDLQGNFKLNGQLVAEKDLPAMFAALKKSEPDPSVVIRGADNVDYKFVVKVIDELQQAEISKVGLATVAAQ
ncbi:MAG TPA: biopolymer transporter ExbD [Candidatus Limnocylindria bacterium]|jgi:biopolymer transport protein ExbD|nr:biopolymer transporter ExbD [Candidatus Limnocylindria bacterium]